METNHLTFLYYKNQLAISRWRSKWSMQGGSFFRTARPLADLRDMKQILDWREIEFLAKAKRGWATRAHQRLPNKPQKKVVNLTLVRFSRERRQKATGIASQGILGSIR
jgi:hypothetical protein